MKNILLCYIILSCSALYSQSSFEHQKFLYTSNFLTIEASTNLYLAKEKDTIKVNLKITNNTKDTVLIYPFKQIQTSISGFSVCFSYPDANYDYYDTLLFIPAKNNLEFNFIILVSKFSKDKFENPYIYSYFSFNFIPSLDTMRKYNRNKEEVYLYKNYLITSHNLIEVCSEFRELSLFLFKKE